MKVKTSASITLAAIFIILIFFPASKDTNLLYFALFKNIVTNPGEGYVFILTFIFAIPFISLLGTIYWYLIYLREEKPSQLFKVNWFALTTFIAFTVMNAVLSETILFHNMSFLISFFPLLLLTFSGQIEAATGQDKIWFEESGKRPGKIWYSPKAISRFLLYALGIILLLWLFSAIDKVWGKFGFGSNNSGGSLFTLSELINLIPVFLLIIIIIYFIYVVYHVVFAKRSSNTTIPEASPPLLKPDINVKATLSFTQYAFVCIVIIILIYNDKVSSIFNTTTSKYSLQVEPIQTNGDLSWLYTLPESVKFIFLIVSIGLLTFFNFFRNAGEGKIKTS